MDHDRARFTEALLAANLPTVLMLLVQLTGDLRWLEEPYRPARPRGLAEDEAGGLPEPERTEIRGAALEAILAWRAGTPVAIPTPSPDLVARMLGVSMGEPVPPEHGPLFAEMLRPEAATDPRPGAAAPAGFRVLIVGAGFSGLGIAIRLRQLGVEFTIVDRRTEVGGTWQENRYPGAGVDVPSHLYSYSFARYDWSHYFARRDEIHSYIQDVADTFDLGRHIRFCTSVRDARYREDEQRWEVTVDGPDGASEVLRADVLISAVGAFNTPVLPAINGLDGFRGEAFHTARWPDDLDLAGKRVAVIGNGASAMQVVPAIAGEVGALRVFQRSPQWMQPFGKMMGPVPDAVRFLMREVELYQSWYRLRWAWIFHDKLHPTFQKDPEWPHPERAVCAANDGHRRYLADYISSKLADHPELLAKALPDYPPFGKRMLLDWGWFEALTRDNVELVTDRIAEVQADRIVTADGVEHPVDVIAMATGFDVVRFVSSFEVYGRSGRTLREAWDDDDGRAYLGLAVPDFPNFFVLYGPNTQPGHGGSLIHTVERQIHYITDLLGQMFAGGLGAVECRTEVFDDYNKRVDAAHEAMIWTHPGMTTYYRNSRNRVVVNMPFTNLEFWHMTGRADLDEYRVEPAGGVERAGAAGRVERAGEAGGGEPAGGATAAADRS
jgi:4-hydroxyacetophenone monooxygenase